MSSYDNVSLGTKLLTAGTAACIADASTFPLDTAKVRLQVCMCSQLEGRIMKFPLFARIVYSLSSRYKEKQEL